MVTKLRWVYGIMLVTLSVGVLVLFASCPENGVGPTLHDGTITVKLTDADAHNDAYFYYAVGATGADLNDPANWLGVAPTNPTIASGTVECITVVTGTNDPKTFTGGENYDIAGLIDVDLSGTTTNGDYAFGPETIVVDGNMILELVYPDDFVEVTGMPIPDDGTITVKVTGAGDHNGRGFMFGVFNEGVTDVFSATSLGGSDLITIVSGTAESVALDEATFTTPIIFTGGMSYVVGGIIDANADDVPSNGDYITDPLKVVVVDGDMVVEFVYPDNFVEITGMQEPEDGTITLRITGADDHNGVGVMGAVGATGADLNDPANCLADFVFEIVNGIGEGAAIPVGADPDTIPPPTPVTFTGGESYDVGGWIDADDDGEYESGVDYIFKEGVKTVVVDGDMILELVYPTEFILAP